MKRFNIWQKWILISGILMILMALTFPIIIYFNIEIDYINKAFWEDGKTPQDTIPFKNWIFGIYCSISVVFGIFIVFISIYSLLIPNESSYNILPNIFIPEVKILISLPGDSSGSLSSMVNSGNLGSLLGLMGENPESEQIGGFLRDLLNLNEIRDKIITEFGFIERYNIPRFFYHSQDQSNTEIYGNRNQ